MENKCWFCENNDADEEVTYSVVLRKHDNRKDKKAVKINRCAECAKKHHRGDLYSAFIYIAQMILVAVAYFVFDVDLVIIAVLYLVLMRPLTALAKKIRNAASSPDKSVCVVAEHDGVKELLEEGYIENRRF